MLFLSIITFLIHFQYVFSKNGIDISVATDTTTFKCLVDDYNITYAIVRAFRSTGIIDEEAPNTIKQAYNQNITDLSVYIFPCIQQSTYSIENQINCPTFKQQIDNIVTLLNSNDIYFKPQDQKYHDEIQMNKHQTHQTQQIQPIYINKLWIDIEDETPSKYYSNNTIINIEFMDLLVKYMSYLNIPIGIYTTKTYWLNIMNNTIGYGMYPLWYPRYDDMNNMSFFETFVDFDEVTIKQTGGNVGYCNSSQIDSDYSI
mgnify:CR=1 FL=1